MGGQSQNSGMADKHARSGQVIDPRTFGAGGSTVLAKGAGFRAFRLVVEAGKSVPSHAVDGPITVYCLEGRCKFFIAGEARELMTGGWLHLDSGVEHSVDAAEKTVLIVTRVERRD